MIVDEFTGRIMPGRRYSDGLHQTIETKRDERSEEKQDTGNYYIPGTCSTSMRRERRYDEVLP